MSCCIKSMGTSSNIALEHDGSLEVSASCLSLDLGAPTLRSRWINLNIFRMWYDVIKKMPILQFYLTN